MMDDAAGRDQVVVIDQQMERIGSDAWPRGSISALPSLMSIFRHWQARRPSITIQQGLQAVRCPN